MAAHRRLVWAAFLLAAFVVFFRLGQLALMDPDEGRNAEVAREMAISGYSLVPTLDGLDYLDKPPLYFAIVATSIRLVGANELAARLPSALAGLATLALLFGYLRPRAGEREAALAVLVAGTAPLLFAFSRIVIFDATLGFFVAAAIFAAALSEEAEAAGARSATRRWHLLSATACAVATMLKGPVGFVVPLLVALLYRRLVRRRFELRFLVRPLGVLVFLAIVLSWFLGTVALRPDFLRYGLVEETFHRLTTGSFHREQPFYYYVGVAIAGLFAWSLLVPEAARLGWLRRATWRRSDRLFIAWTGAVFVFFSLSRSKQPMYVLTGVLALSALVARGLDRALAAPRGPAARALFRGCWAWAALAAASAVFAWTASRPTSALAARFRANGGVGERVLPELGSLAVGLAIVALVAAVAAWRRRAGFAVAAFALFAPMLMIAGAGYLNAYAAARSSRDLARQLEGTPAAEIACFGCFPPSLIFYRRQLIDVVERRSTPMTMASNYVAYRAAERGRWPERIVPVADFGGWLAAAPRPLVVAAPAKSRPELDLWRRRFGGEIVEPESDWSLWILAAPAAAAGTP